MDRRGVTKGDKGNAEEGARAMPAICNVYAFAASVSVLAARMRAEPGRDARTLRVRFMNSFFRALIHCASGTLALPHDNAPVRNENRHYPSLMARGFCPACEV